MRTNEPQNPLPESGLPQSQRDSFFRKVKEDQLRATKNRVLASVLETEELSKYIFDELKKQLYPGARLYITKPKTKKKK